MYDISVCIAVWAKDWTLQYFVRHAGFWVETIVETRLGIAGNLMLQLEASLDLLWFQNIERIRLAYKMVIKTQTCTMQLCLK